MLVEELPIAPEYVRTPLRLGPLTLASRFTLAPLAGYTNLPFRQSVRELGPLGLATTDLVNARAILESSEKTISLLATHPDDRPLAVQIFGSDPGEMAKAARWLCGENVPGIRRPTPPPDTARGAAVASIDINMGCPVRKVVRIGGGSALMCDVVNASTLVKTIVEAVPVPVTVKMRLGWDDDHPTAPELAAAFEELGVAAVTIHGRTREQGFTGHVKLAGIRAVVAAVRRIPVIGNGDVRTLHEAHRMFSETGCAAIAIGRGALLNPWLFGQLHAWTQTGEPRPPASYFDRLDFMTTHLDRLIAWRGDQFGCVQFRKVANWYCKTLRTGKVVQQQLMQLSQRTQFSAIVERLRANGPPPHWQPPSATDAGIAVPTGPIAHW